MWCDSITFHVVETFYDFPTIIEYRIARNVHHSIIYNICRTCEFGFFIYWSQKGEDSKIEISEVVCSMPMFVMAAVS